MLGSRRFGDAKLEQLYRHQQIVHNSTLVLHVLCVLTAALLLIALHHVFNPDLALLYAIIAAATVLALQALLLLKSNESKPSVFAGVVIWLFCAVVGTIPGSGQSSLIPTIIAYFLLYTIFTYDFPTTAVFAGTLTIIQIVGFVVLPTEPFTIHQLIATLLVHIWSNFIGIYLYVTKERLSRAAFLNARNALLSHKEAAHEAEKMSQLLGSALPEHVIAAVRNQIGVNVPKLYIEQYDRVTVIYAKLYGLETILSQISVQDAARLLNEFNGKIDQLVKLNHLVRIQSDAIIVVSGIPEAQNGHADAACQFSWELVHVLRSFCDATTAELIIKIGLASGAVSAGIVGANKWHYEIVGDAYDHAMKLEQNAGAGHILVTNEIAAAVQGAYLTEKFDDSSHRLVLTPRLISNIPNRLLFPSHRRFSLSTISQAINRLFVASTMVPIAPHKNDSLMMSMSTGEKTLLQGRRKSYSRKQLDGSSELLEENEEDDSVINSCTLRFKDPEVEKSFNIVIDRWFIPALAISIFFLVVYGLYQVLVMPRLIATLALIIVTLAAMFVILLMLYVNHFQTFCYFITRTSVGHTVSILLIITLLFICGVVNVFSCPPLETSTVCHNVFYSVISCVLWMLSTTVFIRYSSFCLISTLLGGICIYCIQIFVTHTDLYINYSTIVGWRIEFDLVIGLAALVFIIYLQARRNERLIRLDFLSLIRSMEEKSQLARFEYVNEQILLNALPHHIAYNYLHRTDPYCHLCHSVGVLNAQLGHPSNWNGEIGLNRLNQLIYEVDRLIESYPGIEKVRNSQCFYTAAVGVLPEITRNIHDTPFTIGDLLASLTDFGLTIKQMVEDEGLEVHIGIDCGSALSVVVGSDKPRYEVIGMPCVRAAQLMNAAADYGIVVSEEIYLALRPRDFNFDHNHSITVAPRLIGYVFVDSLVLKQQRKFINPELREVSIGGSLVSDEAVQMHEETIQSTSVPLDASSSSCPPHDPHHFVRTLPANATAIGVTAHNPLEMFTSMNSSMSSDMYSIDVSVESDSEIEWITPEGLMHEQLISGGKTANNNISPSSSRRFWPSTKSISYKGDRAKQYSDFSEADNQSITHSERLRHKRFRPSLSRNGPRVPSWLSSHTSLNSDLSLNKSHDGSVNPLDRVNAAAKRVDKMLQELANVDEFNGNLPEKPFPINFSTFTSSTRSINVDNRHREMSSACHTEYDNAESDGALSDSEMVTSSRLEELKHALRGFSKTRQEQAAKRRRQNTERFMNHRMNRPADTGNDADIDSNCSSLASSTMFDKIRWKSVHSIGYENEYEFASDIDEHKHFAPASDPFPPAPTLSELQPGPSGFGGVGDNSDFLPIDASDYENRNCVTSCSNHLDQVHALSRDIIKNFGEYQLASFSDVDGNV